MNLVTSNYTAVQVHLLYRSLGLDSFISKMECEANSLAMKLLIYMQDQDILENLTEFQIMDYLGLPPELRRYL